MNINHRLSYSDKVANEGNYFKTVMRSMDNNFGLFSDVKRNMMANYKMLNYEIDVEDMRRYITSDLDMDEVRKLQHYDVVISKIRVMLGEIRDRPFNYHAIATNKEAINEKTSYLNRQLLRHGNMLQKKIKEGGLNNIEELKKFNRESFKELNKNYTNYRIGAEIECNNLLKYHINHYNYRHLFQRGFLDALTAAHELYLPIVTNKPEILLLNPLYMTYDISPDIVDIQDSSWAKYDFYLTYDRIYSFLGSKVDNLDYDVFDRNINGYGNYSGVYHGSLNILNDYMHNLSTDNRALSFDEGLDVTKIGDQFMSNMKYKDYETKADTILPTFRFSNVSNVGKLSYYEWKGLMDIQILTRYRDGVLVKDVVNGDYKLDKSMGDKELKKYWVPRVHSGYSLNSSYFFDYGIKEVQFNDSDNPFDCKLGFVGKIYNARNGNPISQLDRAKPFQYIINVISRQIDKLMDSEIGSLLLMDVNAIPGDWDYEEYAQVLKKFRIIPVDTSKQSANRSTFNQFGNVDLSVARGALHDRIEMLQYFQLRCGEVMGITKEREGRVSAGSNVSDNQQSVAQSNLITEYEYAQHDSCVQNVLKQFIEVCKHYYRDNPLQAVMLDDMSPIHISTDIFSNYTYDVAITNSSKDKDLIKMMDGLAQPLIQNGYKISTILKLMNEDYSLSKKLQNLIELEKEQDELKNRMQENQLKQSQAQHEETMQLELKKIEQKIKESQDLNNVKLEIAQMNKDLALQLENIKYEIRQYESDLKSNVKEKEIDVLDEKNEIKRAETLMNKELLETKNEILKNNLENNKSKK